MIGEDSTTWRPPPGSASTGQPPAFWHSATAGCAQIGGSVIAMNSPPETLMIVCAAISADGRSSPALRHATDRGPVLDPDWRRPRATTTDADGPYRHRACGLAPGGEAAYRGRLPFGPPGSSVLVPRRHGEVLRHPAGQELGAASGGDPDLALHRLVSGLAGADSVVRRWTWRNRRITWTTGCPVCKDELGLGRASLRRIGGGVPWRHHHTELPAALVLRERPGTGTGCTPHTRRRWRCSGRR